MSRIPFVAAVVGALLIGGATTGGTHASWVKSAPLSASSVRSGSMSFTLASPSTLATLSRTAGAEGQATFVATDGGAGKNLVQRITATVATTPTGVSAYVATGSTCAGASTSASYADKSPSDASRTQTYCVRVVSSATAVSGNVTLSVAGAQQPTGWTVAAKTVTIPVTINSPLLTCPASSSTSAGMPLTWTRPTGATASQVQYFDGTNWVNAPGASTTSPYNTTVFAKGTRNYRVQFTGGSTATSNQVAVTAENNGNNNMTCVVK